MKLPGHLNGHFMEDISTFAETSLMSEGYDLNALFSLHADGVYSLTYTLTNVLLLNTELL